MWGWVWYDRRRPHAGVFSMLLHLNVSRFKWHLIPVSSVFAVFTLSVLHMFMCFLTWKNQQISLTSLYPYLALSANLCFCPCSQAPLRDNLTLFYRSAEMFQIYTWFLNKEMEQMNKRTSCIVIFISVKSYSTRTVDWHLLVKNMTSYDFYYFPIVFILFLFKCVIFYCIAY